MFKIIADTFSVARDGDHFILLKSLKKPRTDDQIWINIEIVGGGKFARSSAQSIVDTMEEVFFDNEEMDAYERFENSLKEVNLIIKNIKEKRGDKNIGTISAIIAVFSGSELHLTQSKNAEAYLIRGEKLSMISEGLATKSGDLFVNIASGDLRPDDKILFSTSRLLRLATHSQLVNILSDGVTEALDAIRDLVLGNNELSIGVSCLHTKLPQHARLGGRRREIPAFLIKIKEWAQGVVAKATEKIGFEKKIDWKQFGRNRILAAILVIVLLLIISVSFLMDGRRDQVLRDEYRMRIEAMNQDLHTANTKGYANDKETANAILEKVEREARDILATNFFRAEALALLEKVQETRDSINNTMRVSDAAPYVNLTTKKENTEALGVVNLDDNFFAYEYDTLHEVILDQVLDPKTIDETEIVISAAAMEDQDVLIFLTKSGRLMEFTDGEFRFPNTADDSWQPGSTLAAYGRNIYMLSPERNQIYKYSRLRSNYSSATEYNLDADLTGGLSLAIDGDIYVLKEGGEIIRIFKSNEQHFEIEGMAVDISEATKIFTSPELENLYVLDPVNKRVVVIRKNANGLARYEGQIVFGELEGIQDLYVDKVESTLFLLTKKAIYQASL